MLLVVEDRDKYKALLNEVLGRLNAPSKWYKGNIHLHHQGITLYSAVIRATQGMDLTCCWLLGNMIAREAALAFPDRGDTIIHFNDHKDTTYDDVIYAIKAAMTQLEIEDGDEGTRSDEGGEVIPLEKTKPPVQDEFDDFSSCPWGV